MITTSELLENQLLENPFQRYSDTRYFYPHLSEQRRVLEVAYGFILDSRDPAKNLGVITGPSGGGKSVLAQRLAQTHFQLPGRGSTLGLYLNTNTLTEPRHFLMAVIETLGLPSTRSNTNRLESIFQRLEESDDQLLLVLDGPPVDQDYLTQLSAWSVEHDKKIKTLVFLQDLNNNTANIGGLNQFLGLYLPFRGSDASEIASMLYFRCLMAGHPEPGRLFTEEELTAIGESAHGSLAEALRLAQLALEAKIKEEKAKLRLTNFRFRHF